MNHIRKLWKWAVLLAVLFVAAQLCVSFALRTKRMHGYLIAIWSGHLDDGWK